MGTLVFQSDVYIISKIQFSLFLMAIQEINQVYSSGLQVRVGQGPGQTRFLAFKKHGGKRATRALAKQVELELEERWGKKVKSMVGRQMCNNKSGIPGLRFEWRYSGSEFDYLYLVGNYRNKKGHNCSLAYSVEKHGFSGVLLLGLAKRALSGAPKLSLEEATSLIWDHYVEISGISPNNT